MRPICRVVPLSFLVFLGTRAAAAEQFDYGVERDWEFLNQAKFRGSLVKIADGKAYIRMSDGLVREFWPGTAAGTSGSHLRRAMCRLPPNPTPASAAPGAGPLINLNASGLPAGPLKQWRNNGRLGGAFTPMNQPPTVEQVGGRRAVVFGHVPWLLPLEFQTLVSDFYMPEADLGGGGGMTVVAWLCNTGATVDWEIFLCWGQKDCGELDTPDFSYGCYDAMQWYDEKVVFPPARFPKLDQWHQVAYVITPSETDKKRCDLRVYIAGELVTEKSLRRPANGLLRDNLAFIGCAWEAWWGHAWATRPARPYTGALAGLQVYGRALAVEELRDLDDADGPYSPSPADASHNAGPGSTLSWPPGVHQRGPGAYEWRDR